MKAAINYQLLTTLALAATLLPSASLAEEGVGGATYWGHIWLDRFGKTGVTDSFQTRLQWIY